MAWIGTQIDFVMSPRDGERLRQFSRAGTELPLAIHSASPFHERDSAHRFERANQNKTVCAPFHKHVQHPVRAVGEINVSRSHFIALDKIARARAVERVAGFVVFREVSFSLNNYARTLFPYELRANQFARTRHRIAPEE